MIKSNIKTTAESFGHFTVHKITIAALILILSAASHSEINVHFNKSVDHSYAYSGNEANGNTDFIDIMIDRIDAAQYSLDMAVYSFNYTSLSNAVISAYNRGVDVRVVYDDRSIQTGMQYLINAGIPYIQRTDSEGYMHNKFYIFDARDSTSLDDDWVITGSWNATVSGTWSNCQNIVEIQDSGLASAYTIEFNEMFGSTTNVPNTSLARFGNDKLDNTPHLFNIDGVEVELYFSPSDNTTSHIIQQVQTAQSSACFGLLAFTRYDIANALYLQSAAGTVVRGIMNDTGGTGTQWNYLNTFAEMYEWTLSGIFHHKYAFFDYDIPSSGPVILTGSHNWSNAAENNNDENTLIFKSADIVNQYVQEFAARIADLGGSLPPPILETVDDLTIEFFQYNVGLSWTAVPGASSYKVYCSPEPYALFSEWEYLGTTTIPFFMDDDAFYEGVKYYVVTVAG
ncbi:MAG: hypothetical protein HQ591_04570 [candidate division Zixibacteria bacterium]|nr:hypothetical protein [Candidatus Tariuqbacter arcticus]